MPCDVNRKHGIWVYIQGGPKKWTIFTALHCMPAWSWGSWYRPSVCLSVTRVYCDKTIESSADILYHTKGKFIHFFGHKEWLVGDTAFYLKFWVKLTHSAAKRFKTVICNRYSLVAAPPLHLAKKSSTMTNGKSATSFPMSLRWTAHVAPNPPKAASKATIFSFSV